jgi:hypothetical protein
MLRPGWIHGAASIDDDGWVVLRDLQTYPIEFGTMMRQLPFALAGVRSPAEAVAFASDWGLLRVSRPDDDSRLPGPTDTIRERYVDMQREAGRLASIMALYVDLHAALNGDTAVEASLRDVFVDLGYPDQSGLERLEDMVLDFIAKQLNAGREGVTMDVRSLGSFHADESEPDPQARGLAWISRSRILLGTIYQQLTHLMIDKETMRFCQDCSRVFLPKTGKQRFCNDTCAARTRYHRKARRQRESGDAVDAGTQSD